MYENQSNARKLNSGLNVCDLTEIQKIWALPTHLVQALVGWWSGDVLGSSGGLKSVTLCSATNNRSSCMETQNPNNWSPRGLLKLHKKINNVGGGKKKKQALRKDVGFIYTYRVQNTQHDQRSYCSRYHQWVHAWAKDLEFRVHACRRGLRWWMQLWVLYT
jgi:hypothetical protein